MARKQKTPAFKHTVRKLNLYVFQNAHHDIYLTTMPPYVEDGVLYCQPDSYDLKICDDTLKILGIPKPESDQVFLLHMNLIGIKTARIPETSLTFKPATKKDLTTKAKSLTIQPQHTTDDEDEDSYY